MLDSRRFSSAEALPALGTLAEHVIPSIKNLDVIAGLNLNLELKRLVFFSTWQILTITELDVLLLLMIFKGLLMLSYSFVRFFNVPCNSFHLFFFLQMKKEQKINMNINVPFSTSQYFSFSTISLTIILRNTSGSYLLQCMKGYLRDKNSLCSAQGDIVCMHVCKWESTQAICHTLNPAYRT